MPWIESSNRHREIAFVDCLHYRPDDSEGGSSSKNEMEGVSGLLETLDLVTNVWSVRLMLHYYLEIARGIKGNWIWTL